MATLQFDANQVEPQAPLEPVPSGLYNVMIVESDMKPTKAGDGRYLELVLQIIDGQYKGRKLWDRLNLFSKNQTAVQIAQSTLSAICHAVNVIQLQDSQQLHDKPLSAKSCTCRQRRIWRKNESQGVTSRCKPRQPRKHKSSRKPRLRRCQPGTGATAATGCPQTGRQRAALETRRCRLSHIHHKRPGFAGAGGHHGRNCYTNCGRYLRVVAATRHSGKSTTVSWGQHNWRGLFRKLWYRFRWALQENHPGRLYRLFNPGPS